MTEWLKLDETKRKTSLEQAAYEEGIRAKAVEKDWWVTLTLKALFTSKYKEYIIFKGGTSLSKCWRLIQRFSEDIDIALAAEAFGMSYNENPSKGFLSKLRRTGCEFTSKELKTALEKQFEAMGVPNGIIKMETASVRSDIPDTDPQTLLVHYPSLFEPDEYLADVVKIEVSVRSLKEPYANVNIQSVLNENFPEAYPETPFEVTVVEPHRTFLEKMFLLHEEFQKPDLTKVRSERMSRHLYDLERMMDKEPGMRALADEDLYLTIIKHRANYNNMTGVDYTTHEKNKISFIPPKDLINAYAKDYETMRSVMIYGEASNFDDLIKRLNELPERFRTK